jgi:hypothetical protein
VVQAELGYVPEEDQAHLHEEVQAELGYVPEEDQAHLHEEVQAHLHEELLAEMRFVPLEDQAHLLEEVAALNSDIFLRRTKLTSMKRSRLSWDMFRPLRSICVSVSLPQTFSETEKKYKFISHI